MKLTLIQPFGIVLDVITGALYKHRTTYFTSEPKQHREDAVLREEIKGNCRFEGPKRSKIKEIVVPPHGTMTCGKIIIKQIHTVVKFDFVVQSLTQFVTHQYFCCKIRPSVLHSNIDIISVNK